MNEKCWYKEVCKNKQCNSCIRFSEMSYLMENSGIPVKRQIPTKLTCDEIDRDAFLELAKVKDNVQFFVENGGNLYIGSNITGNGKTSWALKILLKYFDTVWAGNGFNVRGYFVHVPTLLNTLKDFNSDHTDLKNILESVDLVVWDDIVGAKTTDYDITQLLSLIDTRMCSGLSNIYTGNVIIKPKLEVALGNRLASRIWAGQIIILEGKDRREW